MLAVAFGFTACSNEDDAVSNAKKGKATVVAFTEPGATRTALRGDDTEGYQVVWSKGDQITIGTEKFTIDDEFADNTTAKFTGNVLNKGEYTALYGIDELVWPAKQTYKEGNVANFPMYASATVDSESNISPLSFKNLGGLLRLTVMGESTRKIKSIEIESTAKMAGVFTINNDAASISTKKGAKTMTSIVLDCGSTGVALSDKGTDFYIAMPQNTTGYTDIKITLTDTKDNMCVKKLSSDKKLVITRSQITKASFTVDEKKFVPGITANSPVGTVGMLNEVEGIVVELNGTNVVVATKNIGATTIDGDAGSTDPEAASCYGSYAMISQENEYFNFTGIGNLGWRMPTKAELEALAANLEWSGDRHGAIWNVTDASTLFLPAAGYYNNNVDKNAGEVYGYINVGNQGLYACKKEKNSSFYNALSFNAEEISVWNLMGTTSTIQNPNLGLLHNCTIRPFHDMPTE